MDRKQNFLSDDDFIQWRLFQTEEQDAQWDEFRRENPHLEQSLDEAIVQFNALKMSKGALSKAEKDAVYSLVLHNINKHKTKKLFLQYASSIAVVLLIGFFSVFYLKMHRNDLELSIVKNNTIIGKTMLDEEVYILSGNNKINLTNNSNLELTQNEAVVITDSTKLKQEHKLTTAAMNTLVVPFGKQSSLTLADGTKICLNSGTQVNFPSKFTGETREISVNGEVFIQVKKDTLRPFIVHTNNMDIQVYGTSFNVSDYEDDLTMTVVLVEGSVAVNTAGREIKLQPNRKLEITNGEITEETVDVCEYICWTKGVLEFNKTPVSEILKKVGRYYNVKFENSPDISLNDKTFSGKLFLSSNLDSVMVSLSLLSATKYQRNDNIIHISKN